MPLSVRSFTWLLGLVLLSGALYWFVWRSTTPEDEIRSTYDGLVEWVSEGAGRESVALALHANRLDRFFSANSRVRILPGRSAAVGLNEIRSMAMGGLSMVDEIRIHSTWEHLEVAASAETAESRVRVRVRAHGRGRQERGDGVLSIRWIHEKNNWRIDTLELISRS